MEVAVEQSEKCLKDLVAEHAKQAKVAEFKKAAEEKLQELATAAETEEKSYQDAKPGFDEKWKEQKEKIDGIRSHLEACFPHWQQCLEQAVCKEVIQKIWKLRDDLEGDQGQPKNDLDHADADLAKAESQMEAWKTITAWIQARLDQNQTLIDEICTLDTCTDRLFALYIFHFELLPAHAQLEKPPKDLPLALRDPERAYCESVCTPGPPTQSEIEFVGNPWLIKPEDYDCKVADVWKVWCEAGKEQAKKQERFDQTAKTREELESASDPAAKREAAREALRRHEQPTPPPHPHYPSPSQPTQVEGA